MKRAKAEIELIYSNDEINYVRRQLNFQLNANQNNSSKIECAERDVVNWLNLYLWYFSSNKNDTTNLL